jgi:prophage antirepressor-like protein
MNEIEIFKNEEFGEVRTIEKNGSVLFCGSDIAKALGYARPADAISAHCKGVCVLPTPSAGGVQNTKFITEGDIYRLIAHSKLPSAERFERWVFDEVLPSIRKNGGYISNADLMVNTYFSNLPDEQKVVIKGLLINIVAVQNENSVLKKENDVLAQENSKWVGKDFINAIVRKYTGYAYDRNFGSAWTWIEFKKKLPILTYIERL